MDGTALSPEKAIEAISGLGGSPKIFGEYIVEGEKSWSTPFITVQKLSFKAGAKLIFDHQVIRKDRNLMVFAEEITSENQEAPGEITWTDLPPNIPVSSDAGQVGVDMAGQESVGGGTGGQGPAGLNGEKGVDAPSLTIIVRKVTSGLRILLKGEEGGREAQAYRHDTIIFLRTRIA